MMTLIREQQATIASQQVEIDELKGFVGMLSPSSPRPPSSPPSWHQWPVVEVSVAYTYPRGLEQNNNPTQEYEGTLLTLQMCSHVDCATYSNTPVTYAEFTHCRSTLHVFVDHLCKPSLQAIAWTTPCGCHAACYRRGCLTADPRVRRP